MGGCRNGYAAGAMPGIMAVHEFMPASAHNNILEEK
jgi:hypothetical protein